MKKSALRSLFKLHRLILTRPKLNVNLSLILFRYTFEVLWILLLQILEITTIRRPFLTGCASNTRRFKNLTWALKYNAKTKIKSNFQNISKNREVLHLHYLGLFSPGDSTSLISRGNGFTWEGPYMLRAEGKFTVMFTVQFVDLLVLIGVLIIILTPKVNYNRCTEFNI